MTTATKQKRKATTMNTTAPPKPPEQSAAPAPAANASAQAPAPAAAQSPAAGPAPRPAPSPAPAPAQQQLSLVNKSSPVGPQLPIPQDVDPLLLYILQQCRAHESEGEVAFLGWLRTRLQSYLAGTYSEVGKIRGEYLEHSDGAVSFTVFNKDEKATTTMFCSHIDTCDSKDDKGTKLLDYMADFGVIMLADKSPGSCLGADDGVGVWIMLRMIEARIPGTYMFHRGEEVGQSSARAITSKERPWLSQFEVAVQFDRPGYNEIITHQRGQQECASQKFALALCEQLTKNGMEGYKPSNRGVYTDCYEYRGVVAECVNVGVGYSSQHSKREELNYSHAYALLQALLKVQWDSLPVDRDPAKVPAYSYYDNNHRGSYGGYGGRNFAFGHGFEVDDDEIPEHAFHNPSREFRERFGGPGQGNQGGKNKGQQKPTSQGKAAPVDKSVKVGGQRWSRIQFDLDLAVSETSDMSLDELVAMAEENPEWAATAIVALQLELDKERAMRQRLMTLLPIDG